MPKVIITKIVYRKIHASVKKIMALRKEYDDRSSKVSLTKSITISFEKFNPEIYVNDNLIVEYRDDMITFIKAIYSLGLAGDTIMRKTSDVNITNSYLKKLGEEMFAALPAYEKKLKAISADKWKLG